MRESRRVAKSFLSSLRTHASFSLQSVLPHHLDIFFKKACFKRIVLNSKSFCYFSCIKSYSCFSDLNFTIWPLLYVASLFCQSLSCLIILRWLLFSCKIIRVSIYINDLLSFNSILNLQYCKTVSMTAPFFFKMIILFSQILPFSQKNAQISATVTWSSSVAWRCQGSGR